MEDIAALVGFGSAETMRRAFIRRVGVAPSFERAARPAGQSRRVTRYEGYVSLP